MALSNKLLEQIAFNTIPRIEEHIFFGMDKSTHEEHLAQPLQTNNKQFKTAVTFQSGFIGIFKITNTNNKFYFKKSVIDEGDFKQVTIPAGANEIESLNEEIKRIIVEKEYFTDANCPFTIKPNFSTLGFNIENSPQGPIISFASDDIIRNLLGFHETLLYKDYNLSDDPVDILSFDNNFLECDIVQGVSFRG